jgi:hypothetical protein
MESGTVGVCYETYEISGVKGVSIIFRNGEYDGFSVADQAYFLEKIVDTNFTYEFKSVIHVTADFNKGIFDKVLRIDPVKKLYE